MSTCSEALVRLRDYPSIDEGVILSTCNRVEVVAAAGDVRSAFNEINGFLASKRRTVSGSNG